MLQGVSVKSAYIELSGKVLIIECSQAQCYAILDRLLTTFKITGSSCGTCPQFVAPHPDACKDGTLVPGNIDECGCQQPPTCTR